jgi:2-polyprenyl-3-methyl-5-hydroxy-6-metoxy-1,4-benzoquinol methylase
MKMSEEVRREIVRNMADFCRTVRKVDPEEALSFIVADKYLSSQADYYAEAFRRSGIDPRSSRILEVGSGYGFFLSHARSALGWNIWGIEPGEEEFSGRSELASEILRLNGVEPGRLVRSAGESLCFKAGSFDAVISNDVLEHVADPESVVRESARVLRTGGLLAFNMPNYRWIYEGHYNTPWIPAMSKPLARRYVSLLGRDPSYVDTLNFLSPGIVKKILAKVPELRLVHPLEEGCADFLPLRIGAYLDAAGSHQRTGASLHAFRALHWLSGRAAFKSAMKRFASVTGVYHEMHLTSTKR